MRYAHFVMAAILSGCTSMPAEHTLAFPKFRSADANRILPTAAGGGYLTQRGQCLGLAGRSGGGFRTVIWPETASLTFDAQGPIITDSQSGAVARLGDYLAIGGGVLPAGAAARLAPELTEPVPAECLGAVGTVNPGFRRASSPPGA